MQQHGKAFVIKLNNYFINTTTVSLAKTSDVEGVKKGRKNGGRIAFSISGWKKK